MQSVYLISLIVGGFFVVLSMFGGDTSDADADAEVDFDHDIDHDFSTEADIDAGPGFVDLLSVRALFLFAAFFGLTGTLLGLTNSTELITLFASVIIGLVVGLGGNYVIKAVAYKHVSSGITTAEMKGKTGQVLIPFGTGEKGKIRVVIKGSRRQLVAISMDEDLDEFKKGDDVVIVRMSGSLAEVIKPE